MAKKKNRRPRRGAPPPEAPREPTEEELLEILKMDIMQNVLGLTSVFGPNLTEDKLREVGDVMAKEQQRVAKEIIPTLTDPEKIEAHPFFAVGFSKMGEDRRISLPGQPQSGEVQFMCKKRLQDCDNVNEALITVLLLNFLLSAPWRTMLRLHGYNYRFFQVSSPKQQSKITLT